MVCMCKWRLFQCHFNHIWLMNDAKKASSYFLGQNHSKTANVIWWIFGDGLACCPIERILVWRELYLGPDIFKVLAARYSTLKYSTLRNIQQTQRHENCKLPSYNIVPSIIYGRSATQRFPLSVWSVTYMRVLSYLRHIKCPFIDHLRTAISNYIVLFFSKTPTPIH